MSPPGDGHNGGLPEGGLPEAWTPADVWAAIEELVAARRLDGQGWACRAELVDVRTTTGGWVTATLVGDDDTRLDAAAPPWVAAKMADYLTDGVAAEWVVQLECKPAWGRIRLRIVNFVVGTIRSGDRAAHLAALWARLEPNADVNGQVPVPAVPGRVAVVASPSSAGWRDVQARLADEPRIDVQLLPARMGGPDAADEIAGRLRSSQVAAADVVVVARGGGDGRQWANSGQVAEAIIGCRRQVWTAIGHTGEEHLADRVAAASFGVPAAAATELLERWADRDAAAARQQAVEAARTRMADRPGLVGQLSPAQLVAAALLVAGTVVVLVRMVA